MGNLLAGIAPSQIFPVEHYLTDFPEYLFDASLGSTRFFKVARAKFREGLTVVKVFAIHDPTLPLKSYKEQLEDIKRKLLGTPNCLPFQKALLTDKAGLLFRQYVKDNLYDRISTRPFMNHVEKKWIAFQILCALSRCHELEVYHGDIKLENIMITGWNWVLLADFASFKPTYLPEDNPADFSYFFDTSRRRTCYIAPERFVKTLSLDGASSNVTSHLVLPDDEFKKGDLTAAMDIFSVGGALTELFTEGHAPFDYSQLLMYCTGDYSPRKVCEKIDDQHIQEMVLHMMQKDASQRLSAAHYLESQRGKAFPDYFYDFLMDYMITFASAPILSPDDKISRINRDIHNVINKLCPDGLLIIVSLVTSSLRALKHCTSKLQALEILQELAPHLCNDIILDRLLPYMLYFVNDTFPQVRVASINVLTACLGTVNSVPRSDANIFPEYILPHLASVVHDEAVIVRITYAKNIALLAETALRFLEMAQLGHIEEQAEYKENGYSQYQAGYDAELQVLHEMIQQKVSALLTDPENIVKQTLLQTGITRLCVFFGRQKANDVLLSHMITFLNDKRDCHLRAAFFDSIVGVAAYVGWQSSPILKPLLQQGLNDAEEFVTSKVLRTLASMAELGLLQKHLLCDLLAETSPFLIHPNLWIRTGTVAFICAAAKTLSVVDVHCKLLPLLKYIKEPVIQIDKEEVLLSVLKPPIPRSNFDWILRSPQISLLMETLHKRKLTRGCVRAGYPHPSPEMESSLAPLHRRLLSDGMTEVVEEQILALKDHLVKVQHARVSVENWARAKHETDGVVNLSDFRNVPRRTKEFLCKSRKTTVAPQSRKATSHKKQGQLESPNTVMNEEWQHMFGSLEQNSKQQPRVAEPMTQSLPQSKTVLDPNPQLTPAQLQETQELPPPSPRKLGTHEKSPIVVDGQDIQYCVASCKFEMRELTQKKFEQHTTNALRKEISMGITLEPKHPPVTWKPKGQLVAHLHEHKGGVNKIEVIPETTLFATCSDDGSIKVWDCGRMEGRNVANRSRQTYMRQEGPITSLSACEGLQSLAAASDIGTVHVFRIETSSTKMTTSYTRTLDPQEEGCVVDMKYFDTGSQCILSYATVYGSIVGWDLRSPGTAWKLQNDIRYGLITSFCVDRHHCWLAAGTSSGCHVCWDLRFQLPISMVEHPTRARVRQLQLHPYRQSWVVSAVQGNNEVSMWDMETGARQVTLWASSAPPLSQTQASNHAVHSMSVAPRDGNPMLLTAGSDMRIRLWDLNYPSNSCIVVGAANDFLDPTAVSYKSRLIDGTEVIQETYSKSRQAGEDAPRRGPEAPPAGHHDSISDIGLCQTSQWLLLSSSLDGVVKVWK